MLRTARRRGAGKGRTLCKQSEAAAGPPPLYTLLRRAGMRACGWAGSNSCNSNNDP